MTIRRHSTTSSNADVSGAVARGLAMLIALAMSTGLIAATSSPHYADPRGVYARLGAYDATVPQAALDNPSIDGIALYTNWDTVERQKGIFDWSWIDNVVAQAAAHHKKVSLGITAGADTPAWVYADGATAFDFTWREHWGFTPCSRQRMPVPWDPVFLSRWKEFVDALGVRYNSNPNVSLVHITGINAGTDETFLPGSRGGSIGGQFGIVTCQIDDEVSHWQRLGYTRKKLETAWLDIATEFSRAFSDKLIVPVIFPASFPSLDDNGSMENGKADYRVAPDLIAMGHRSFGDQFGAQNNGLSASWIYEEIARHSSEMVTGYQMLVAASRDKRCHLTNGREPCDPHETLQASMNAAIQSGAHYVEIILPDVLDPRLQDVLADAHRRLTSSSG
jgi:hypothetical protein